MKIMNPGRIDIVVKAGKISVNPIDLNSYILPNAKALKSSASKKYYGSDNQAMRINVYRDSLNNLMMMKRF